MKTPRFNLSRRIFLAVGGIAVWISASSLSTAATISAGTDPEINSAFEYNQMTSIVPSNPQVNGSFDVRDMFGGAFGIEQAIFEDIAFVTSTYSVTFTLNAPIELIGYKLYLGNDGNDTFRALSRVEFLQGATVLSDVTVSSTYFATYGSHSIVIEDTFDSVIASEFTIRFYGGDSEYNGVRVYDLDATVVPEPTTALLLSGGIVGIFALRRRKIHA